MSLYDVAEDAIRDHAKDVEFMSLLEMYDITDAEAEEVLDLIAKADIAVTWKAE